MRDGFQNNVKIKGYVFNHSLVKKVSGPNSKTPGVAFIMGDLNIATDEDAMNIVPVHFTYVTESYKNGNANSTYALLAQIIDDNNTYELNGKSAMKVRIDGEIETNDFVTRDNEMASPKRIRGSFAHPETGDIAKVGSAEFEVDMLIEGKTKEEIIQILNEKEKAQKEKEAKLLEENKKKEELNALRKKVIEGERLLAAKIISREEYEMLIKELKTKEEALKQKNLSEELKDEIDEIVDNKEKKTEEKKIKKTKKTKDEEDKGETNE